MNILHHKSWHVRNKDNILRVKKDEENARKEEEERLRRAALAESEARTEVLRQKARTHNLKPEKDVKEEKNDDLKISSTKLSGSGHINFFSEIEEGKKEAKGNQEYEKEKREEKEKQEKAIGLLTYLGQSAIESQEEKPWYLQKFGTKRKREVDDEPTYKSTKESEEFNKKFKKSLDPLHMMNKYVDTKRKIEDKDYKPSNRPVYRSIKKEEKPVLNITKGEASGSDRLKSKESQNINKKEVKKKSKKSSHKKHKKEKRKKKKNKKKHKRKHRCHKDSSSSSSCDSSSDSGQDTDSSSNSETSLTNEQKTKPSSSTTKSIAELRAERLKREQAERLKTKKLFDKMSGVKDKQEEAKVVDDRDRQYNSVFNPEFVRKPKRRKTDYSDFE